MDGVEIIEARGRVLAYIIRDSATAAQSDFVTPNASTLQAGFIVYQAGGRVVPHIHLPVARNVVGTPELLLVRSGRCIVDVYDTDRSLVGSRELGPGDGVLSLDGGHGFRMLQDTVLLELKQGPYTGEAEKERFEPTD